MLVSDLPPWVAGGLERHVGDLAVELRARGIRSLIVAGSAHSEMRGGVIATATLLSRLPGAFRDRERPLHPPWPDPAFTRALINVGRRWQPTVIHAHGWSAASAAVAAQFLHLPLVVTLHDYGFVCPTKTMYRHGTRACPGATSGAHGDCAADLMGTVKSQVLNLALPLYRQLIKRASLIAVSESVRQAANITLHRDAHVIPNFVRDGFFSDLAEPAWPTPRVLFLGGNNPVKGLSVIDSAMSGSTAKLTVAGAPPSLLNPNVTYVGIVAHDGITDLIDASNIVVVPSLWEEPCPTAALEAMARSRSVIGSRVGGIVDMLQDGAGLLVTPNDWGALAAAIDRLTRSTLVRRQVTSRARDRASSMYSASAVIPQILTTYEAAQ